MRTKIEKIRELIKSRPWVEWVNELLLVVLDRVNSIKEISQRILDRNAEFSKK